ncbi:hypothetical protein [Comamonas thiooxydans]|uniref:hypothetical protein n=2 Tax=Comamonas thiooxydans TaxID=363952 RepID=UPI0005F78F43|nr:hypothetical protein [Comamonas thiooxydans]CUB01444.1 hypothetical protein Ga0061062_11444 [Comamonas thiooxydans]
MAELFNPFNRRVTGEPFNGLAPVQLRVEEGSASRDQVRAVQDAFARFARRATFAHVPNPTESGVLGDGSPYRITTVGNTTIVQLWPEQPDLESGDRGVLVRTAAQLYLVGYHAGRWRYRKVNSAFGGTGAWVSNRSARYFTDATNRGGDIEEMPNRKHRLRDSVVPQPRSASSIALGMAYGDANGGLGFIGVHGVYVQAKLDKQSVSVAEAPLVSDASFVISPDEVFAVPEVIATFTPVLPADTVIADVNGVARESRLRGGTGVSVGVVSPSQSIGLKELPTLAQRKWIAEQALTHELKLRINSAGGYELDTVAVGSANMTVVIPAGVSFPPTSPQWRQSSQGSMRSSQSGLFVIPFREGGIAPAQVNFTRQVAWDWVYQYEFTRSAPVLLGYGWNDDRQVFSLQSQDSQHVTVRLDRPDADSQALARGDGIYFYRYINVENIEDPPEGGRVSLLFQLPEGEAGAAVLQEWRDFIASAAISEAAVKTRSGQLVSKKLLQTPWGSIALLDVDVQVVTEYSYEVRHNNELLQPELFTIRAVEGIAARRQLLYIDPLLEFVAYLEVVTQAFVPAGVNDASTVTTSGTKAAVVFERKGQVFFRQSLAGVAEASVTGGKGSWLATEDLERSVPPEYQSMTEKGQLPATGPEGEQLIVGCDVPYYVPSYDAPLEVVTTGATLTPQNYPIPWPSLEALPSLAVRAAIDPGSWQGSSAAGVVELLQEDKVVAAWALPPRGSPVPLASIAPINPAQMTGFIASA